MARRPTESWAAVALLCAVFLFVWLYLDPSSKYYSSAPAFFLGEGFLRQHLGRPGGWLEYASAFLAQMDCLPWLGALVFSTMVGLLSLGIALLLRRSGSRLGLACALPGFGLLARPREHRPEPREAFGLRPVYRRFG